jgi:energy-coupling factor transporter ATP-binding protein EcfA2
MDNERLNQLAARFYQEMQASDELKSHLADHQRRSQRAQVMLTPERIPTLTEADLRELFFDSDAFGFWSNKEREFNNRLQSVGLDGLRQALVELITRAERGLTPDDLKQVWDMRGLGTLLATELLAYRFPSRYWTYSPNVTLPAFKQLGDDVKASMPRGRKSEPHLYLALEPRIAQVRQALSSAGIANPDNLFADIFLWWVQKPAKPEKQASPEASAVHYWKISPGKQAWAWEEFRQRSVIAIGWTQVAKDLRQIAPSSREDLQARLQGLDKELTGQALVHAARQLWIMYKELQPGDLICAYGQKQILGWGEIVGGYTFQSDDFRFRHRREVRWHSIESISIDRLSPELQKKIQMNWTIFPLTQNEFAEIQKVASASASQGASWKPPFDLGVTLARHLAARGFRFTPWQIATFYTALQTKGFVILSGISGTGKTKLAQHFAALLPQPTRGEVVASDEIITLTVQPYMLKYGRLIVPKQATRLFDPPPPGETHEVNLSFGGQSQTCRLVHAAYGDSDYLSLLLRGTARQWFSKNLSEGAVLILEPDLDRDQNLVGFRLSTGEEQLRTSHRITTGQNWLFVPVRPDWRDSKSLLGYYNPLTSAYEWTQFLRFLLRAVQSYRAGDGLAWFVILDEMNLAHVEYYFADLLSVLESGRDEEGWTREPLRLGYPDDAEGDLPQRELRLPPNLYIVGTVNVDETTQSFSPKVLDRAFTLELTEADFSTYPPEVDDNQIGPNDTERRGILEDFTLDGAFVRIDKQIITDYLAGHPEVRTRLQALNDLLRPYDLHFGYRVFDEIVSFLAAAEHNKLFADLGDAETAFDAAVLMKVLPKFHGSRGKLEVPLRAVLAWCIDPDAPAEGGVANALKGVEAGNDVAKALAQLPYRYPRTAERARRMLRALYTDGFAAFG